MKKIHLFWSILLLCTAVPTLVFRFIESPSAADSLNLLGYFTILSNIFAVVVVALSLFRIKISDKIELAIGAALVITALIFQLFLLKTWDKEGFSRLLGHVNHGTTPLFYLFWFCTKQRESILLFKDLWVVIPYPLVYCLYGIIEGFIKGEFRYFFLDIPEMGFIAFMIWFVLLTLLFILSGAFFMLGDRLSNKISAKYRDEEG